MRTLEARCRRGSRAGLYRQYRHDRHNADNRNAVPPPACHGLHTLSQTMPRRWLVDRHRHRAQKTLGSRIDVKQEFAIITPLMIVLMIINSPPTRRSDCDHVGGSNTGVADWISGGTRTTTLRSRVCRPNALRRSASAVKTPPFGVTWLAVARHWDASLGNPCSLC